MATTKGSTEKAKTEKELSIIEKVRKLMEFTVENGATESEMENAVKAAHKLMMRYNLDAKDIEVTSKDVNTTLVESTWVDRTETRPFEARLLNLLAKHFSCKIVRNRDQATNKDSYDVIGFKDDRDVLVATYDQIILQVRVLAHKRYKESDKAISEFRFTTSYNNGFLEGLDEKLEADKKGFFKAGERKEYDLMIVKKDALVEEWVGANLTNIKTKSVAIPKSDAKAHAVGKEDGVEKGLKNQLGSKGSTVKEPKK